MQLSTGNTCELDVDECRLTTDICENGATCIMNLEVITVPV